jgi:hypothetical protein
LDEIQRKINRLDVQKVRHLPRHYVPASAWRLAIHYSPLGDFLHHGSTNGFID